MIIAVIITCGMFGNIIFKKKYFYKNYTFIFKFLAYAINMIGIIL